MNTTRNEFDGSVKPQKGLSKEQEEFANRVVNDIQSFVLSDQNQVFARIKNELLARREIMASEVEKRLREIKMSDEELVQI